MSNRTVPRVVAAVLGVMTVTLILVAALGGGRRDTKVETASDAPADAPADPPAGATGSTGEQATDTEATQTEAADTEAPSTPSTPSTQAGPPMTSCTQVVHIGDSTSIGLTSPAYLPNPADRIDAQ